MLHLHEFAWLLEDEVQIEQYFCFVLLVGLLVITDSNFSALLHIEKINLICFTLPYLTYLVPSACWLCFHGG